MKTLLVLCLLYVCYSTSQAYLSRVASLTGSVVQQSVAAHVQRNVYGHGKQFARAKREVVTKTMDDPKGCLSACRDNETAQLVKVVIKNTGRLVAIALENVDITDLATSKGKQNEDEMKRKIEESTIQNMGPLFEDMCRVHKNTSLCYSKCPDTQSRTILSLDNQGDQEIMCEPSRNWGNFSEYFAAVNCTNTTETSKACDGKCGRQQSIRNATHLAIDKQSTDDDEEYNFGDDDEGSDDASLSEVFTKSREKNDSNQGIIIKYETDSKKNDAASGVACKSITCHVECFKPIITQKCGAKAYDLYNRMTKAEPHYSLAMLRALKAVDHPDECKAYQ